MGQGISTRLMWMFMGAVLVCLCAAALAVPQRAHAEGLQAPNVALTTQASGDNTSKYYSQILSLGKKATGMFESKDDTNTNLYDYWYKFKTSGRWSVYRVKVINHDGRKMDFCCYDDNDNKVFAYGYGAAAFRSDSYTKFISSPARKAWYYFCVAGYHLYESDVLRYDQFTIVVTEHPIVKAVTGVKVPKKTKSSITVKWNKQKNATKYQVKLGGKTKTVTGNPATFTGLKAGKSYRVKVRAYRAKGWNLDAGKVASWGNWSTVKTVKTKKK